MKKILLSAFACDPDEGSEPGNGWNWAIGLAHRNYEVHCFTRSVGQRNISRQGFPPNLFFHYINLPFGLDALYSFSQPTMYLHYLFWQWLAYRKARKLNKKLHFDVVHHVTWGSIQLGSFLYKIPVPFIFGPAGGGQQSPEAFKCYFKESWASEVKREKVSRFLIKYNPACKKMIDCASAVWVSNLDTSLLVKNMGASDVRFTLDAALPSEFFPKTFHKKITKKQELKLLWVGRLMPRKGILLILQVMEFLKEYSGITLTIVGDGEQKELMLAEITKKNLQSRVCWKGKVAFEEIKEYYEKNDVFIFSSLRDSCPAQLVEAMAYGMPVVTLNLHGQAIIVNDETGFRCPCDTPEQAVNSMAKAVITLYENPALLSSMSIAAHNFALKQSWSSKISSIVDSSYPL